MELTTTYSPRHHDVGGCLIKIIAWIVGISLIAVFGLGVLAGLALAGII